MGLQPPLVKLFRQFNPKIQAFKRVLNLTLSMRGGLKRLGNVIRLMTSEF